jgi:hypothetical protein
LKDKQKVLEWDRAGDLQQVALSWGVGSEKETAGRRKGRERVQASPEHEADALGD